MSRLTVPMPKFSIQKPTHTFDGRKIKRRKAFKTSTKKMEWMSAGGKDPLNWKTNFVKKSKCRRCGKDLTWKDRTYEFDHKDNDSSKNSQRNCYLVCRGCHGKHTIIKKRKIKDRFTGLTIGHKTIKLKPGYKKQTRRKTTKKKSIKRKSAVNNIESQMKKLQKAFEWR